jgi:GGDEF domain-containing protein
LLLFGHPTLEPLSRKMLEFGCDDYIVTPPSPTELQQMFGAASMRLTPAQPEAPEQPIGPELAAPAISATGKLSLAGALSLSDMILDAILQHPADAPAAAIRQLNDQLGPTMQLVHAGPGAAPPHVPDGMTLLGHATRSPAQQPTGTLHLLMPRDEDEPTARHLLAQVAHLMSKLDALKERHYILERAATTDDLTGLYNSRYFRQFLSRLIKKAHESRFPVTLLLFDIDNFKRYNDQYGHGVGDEILKQTAALIRRCCREHDRVARISGDEFAVIFWDKEPPRQPRDASKPATGSRVPQTIVAILERFQNLIASSEFSGLGASGRGVLSISGGLAVYPYDAHTPEALIEAADRALMFGAKKSGKNSIFLVGTPENPVEG